MSIFIPIGYSPKSSSHSNSSQSFQFTSTNPNKFDFAEQLHFKLANLVVEKRQIMSTRGWPNERRTTLDELDDEDEEGDISRTPERMCEWMRVQSNRPQFDTFSNAMESSSGKNGLMAIPFDHRQFWSNQKQTLRDKNAESCHSNSSGFCSSESVAAGQIQSANYSPCAVSLQLVISFREGPGAPPFVVKIPPRDSITFREFRHFFGIPLNQNKRFFFKEFCEDGSAPLQWHVIDDDSMAVPIFQGRISAECRTLSESE